MQKILGLYFSGTGNTKYAIHKLCGHFTDAGKECRIFDICETGADAFTGFDYDTVVVAFPTYGSLMPAPLTDFLSRNEMLLHNKNLITLVTQFCYSGDGGAMVYNMLGHLHIQHLAGIHVNLPSNLSDFRLLGVKNGIEIEAKVKKADDKIKKCALNILDNQAVYDGRKYYSRFLGGLQRAPYKPVKKHLFPAIIIEDNCTQCGVCVKCCPVGHISIQDNKMKTHGTCASCYRCINKCPAKAIRLFGNKPPEKQYLGIDFQQR